MSGGLSMNIVGMAPTTTATQSTTIDMELLQIGIFVIIGFVCCLILISVLACWVVKRKKEERQPEMMQAPYAQPMNQAPMVIAAPAPAPQPAPAPVPSPAPPDVENDDSEAVERKKKKKKKKRARSNEDEEQRPIHNHMPQSGQVPPSLGPIQSVVPGGPPPFGYPAPSGYPPAQSAPYYPPQPPSQYPPPPPPPPPGPYGAPPPGYPPPGPYAPQPQPYPPPPPA